MADTAGSMIQPQEPEKLLMMLVLLLREYMYYPVGIRRGEYMFEMHSGLKKGWREFV